jgi:hypothetical protein
MSTGKTSVQRCPTSSPGGIPKTRPASALTITYRPSRSLTVTMAGVWSMIAWIRRSLAPRARSIAARSVMS